MGTVRRAPAESACRAYTADEAAGWSPIERASSSVYAPRQDDVGRCLRVTAHYADELEDDQRATAVLEVAVRGRRHTPTPDPEPEEDGGFVNAAPVFPDQDHLTPGVQNEETTRTVAENTRSAQPIGAPVIATDADGDLLIYPPLGGPDGRHFDIVRTTGQIRTWRPLNYEAKNTYTVVVTARDPFGATASIVVTINVTDEDDPPVITVRSGR